MVNSRAQSAIEFLISNGWAILIVIILLATLFYIGVLNPQQKQPNICAFSPGFSCYNFRVGNGTGSLELDFGQALGKSIQVTGISCSQNESAAMQSLGSVTVPSGEHRWITGGDSGNTGITCEGATGEPGERYKGKVCVNYTESGTSTQRVVCGEINARLEPAPTPAPTPVPGWLYGTIRNCSGPLDNVTVTAGSKSNITDTNGQYIIYDIAPGTRTVIASKPGHASSTKIATVTSGNGTQLDFSVLQQVILSSCQVIDQCAYYLLDRDLNSSTDCITMIYGTPGARGSVLDCAGHSLTGQQSGSGVHIYYETNLTVKDCAISNFSSGIYLEGASYSTIANNNLSSNSYIGIYSVWATGNNITGNKAAGSGYGLLTYYTGGNYFSNNSATSNGYDFICQSSTNNDQGGNICNKNYDCTWLTCGPPANSCPYSITECCNLTRPGIHYLANNLTANGTCITVYTGGSPPTLDCQGKSITGPGTGSGASGIYFELANGATVQNCVISNFTEAIHLLYSTNNKVKNNTLTSSSYGVHLDYSSYNTVTGNRVSGSSYSIWSIGSTGNNITGNTVAAGGYGIMFYYRGDNYASNNTATGNGYDFLCQSSSNNDEGDNICNKNIDCEDWLSCGPPANSCPYSITECCNLTRPGIHYLANNLTANGSCITVYTGGNNTPTLDCQGKSITGQHTGYGIYFDFANGATVRNCTIADFYDAIDLQYSTNNIIASNNITSNGYTGVYLEYSGYNTVIGNTMSANPYSIFSVGATGNNITGNTLTDNNYGVLLYWRDGNYVSGNTVTNSNWYDFLCQSSSDIDQGGNICNKRDDCTSWLNCSAPPGSCPPVITSCCNLASAGVHTLADNLTSNSTCITVHTPEGVTPTLDCQGKSITGEGNGYGIYFDMASGATVQNCVISNFTEAVYLSYSTNNKVKDNNITSSSYGVHLDYSSYNTVTGNRVSGSGYSIWSSSSTGNNITGNTVAAGGYGIMFYSTGGNYASNNTATGSGYDFLCQSSSNYDEGSNICVNNIGCTDWLTCSSPP